MAFWGRFYKNPRSVSDARRRRAGSRSRCPRAHLGRCLVDEGLWRRSPSTLLRPRKPNSRFLGLFGPLLKKVRTRAKKRSDQSVGKPPGLTLWWGAAPVSLNFVEASKSECATFCLFGAAYKKRCALTRTGPQKNGPFVPRRRTHVARAVRLSARPRADAAKVLRYQSCRGTMTKELMQRC